MTPADRTLLEAARQIACGRTWAGLRILLDHLEAAAAIDASELAALREWTIAPGMPRPKQRQRQRPRPGPGGAA